MADMRPDALKVADQIKNVSSFIYVYGKIVNTLEVADEQAKKNQTSAEIQAKNQKSKDQLVATIRGVRAGLENLAKGFQANPRMQVQFLKITNATEAAANAERLAAAGRYDDAGKALVTVVDRLTETLISMRLL
jgi:prephenate dehydratase